MDGEQLINFVTGNPGVTIIAPEFAGGAWTMSCLGIHKFARTQADVRQQLCDLCREVKDLECNSTVK